MPVWDPEVVVDTALARELVAGQFPTLADRPIRFLAAGWDNAVYLVDERWTFRFPQRAIAIPGIRREIDVLPELAPLLPAPVPDPAHVGRPTERYPWPFIGARLVPGQELAAAGLDDARRTSLAVDLGGFLAELHRPELVGRFRDRLPVDPMRRADMPHRVRAARDWLAEAAALGLWDAADGPVADRCFAAAEELPEPDPGGLRVTHGDLHLRHALVDGTGRLSGVIDFGDMCLADPAIDLSLAWTYLEGDARAAFLEAYGSVAAASELRARVLGLMLCAALAVYARDQGLPWLEEEAAAGLRRSLRD